MLRLHVTHSIGCVTKSRLKWAYMKILKLLYKFYEDLKQISQTSLMKLRYAGFFFAVVQKRRYYKNDLLLHLHT